jgi:hypothetical protein
MSHANHELGFWFYGLAFRSSRYPARLAAPDSVNRQQPLCSLLTLSGPPSKCTNRKGHFLSKAAFSVCIKFNG